MTAWTRDSDVTRFMENKNRIESNAKTPVNESIGSRGAPSHHVKEKSHQSRETDGSRNNILWSTKIITAPVIPRNPILWSAFSKKMFPRQNLTCSRNAHDMPIFMKRVHKSNMTGNGTRGTKITRRKKRIDDNSSCSRNFKVHITYLFLWKEFQKVHVTWTISNKRYENCYVKDIC